MGNCLVSLSPLPCFFSFIRFDHCQLAFHDAYDRAAIEFFIYHTIWKALLRNIDRKKKFVTGLTSEEQRPQAKGVNQEPPIPEFPIIYLPEDAGIVLQMGPGLCVKVVQFINFFLQNFSSRQNLFGLRC